MGRRFRLPIPGRRPGAPAGHERFRVYNAILIVVVSVSGAFVAWRASVVSSQASDLDQQAMQQLLLRHREAGDQQASVAQDFRLFGTFQEHAMLWKLLGQQADDARKHGHVALADDLSAQARTELALARSLQRLFTVQFPAFPDNSTGTVEFDPRSLVRARTATDPTIEGVHPDGTFTLARDEHEKAVHLVGIAALFAAALLFFTVAELGKRRASRRIYGVAGSMVWVAGVVLFAVVQAGGP